jgi:hypothetical protein
MRQRSEQNGRSGLSFHFEGLSQMGHFIARSPLADFGLYDTTKGLSKTSVADGGCWLSRREVLVSGCLASCAIFDGLKFEASSDVCQYEQSIRRRLYLPISLPLSAV